MTGYLIFFFVVWFIGNLFAGIMELTYYGATESSTLGILLQPEMYNFSDPISGIGTVFDAAPVFMQTLWDALLWNYPFFENEFVVVKLFALCISAGFIVTLVLTIVGSVTGRGGST